MNERMNESRPKSNLIGLIPEFSTFHFSLDFYYTLTYQKDIWVRLLKVVRYMLYLDGI